MSQLRSGILYRVAKNLVEYRRLVRNRNSVQAPDQGYPAYVINLERCPERRLYIVSHLASIRIRPTLVDAFDGKKLAMNELVAAGKYDDSVARRAFSRSLSLAEIGCVLSHLSIYQSMVRDGVELALITEDDAQFVSDACERIQRLIADAPVDWELIQLRFDCRDFLTVSPTVVDFRFRSSLPVGSTSYLMKLSAAQKIVANAFPVRYPADSMLGRANRWGVRMYGAWPEIVGVNNVFPSAIYAGRDWRFRVFNFVKVLILKALR